MGWDYTKSEPLPSFKALAAQFPDRSADSVKTKLQHLRRYRSLPRKPNQVHWSPEDYGLLRALFQRNRNNYLKDFARLTGRSQVSIKEHAKALGLLD